MLVLFYLSFCQEFPFSFLLYLFEFWLWDSFNFVVWRLIWRLVLSARNYSVSNICLAGLVVEIYYLILFPSYFLFSWVDCRMSLFPFLCLLFQIHIMHEIFNYLVDEIYCSISSYLIFVLVWCLLHPNPFPLFFRM